MLRMKHLLAAYGSSLLLIVAGSHLPQAVAGDWPTEDGCREVQNPDNVMKGWCLAISRKKGNCLACHHAMVDPWPEALPPGGNLGPPFVAMAARFPDRDELRAQIWDAQAKNPNTSMPPFGRHRLLSEVDIDHIVDWLLTL